MLQLDLSGQQFYWNLLGHIANDSKALVSIFLPCHLADGDHLFEYDEEVNGGGGCHQLSGFGYREQECLYTGSRGLHCPYHGGSYKWMATAFDWSTRPLIFSFVHLKCDCIVKVRGLIYQSAILHGSEPFWHQNRKAILRENKVNAMAADVLAPCVTRSSAAVLLMIQDKWVIVFRGGGFWLLVSSWCQKMIENTNTFLSVLKKKKHQHTCWGNIWLHLLLLPMVCFYHLNTIIIPPAHQNCWGYIGFTPSVRSACRFRSVARCLFHGWYLYVTQI